MPPHRLLLVGPLLLASASAALVDAATAAPSPVIVSRADGDEGRVFPSAALETATRDGRFVLFSGPLAEAASEPYDTRTTLFLRDRVAGTTTPVLRADGAFGRVWVASTGSSTTYRGLDVSPDGTKVLFSGPKQDGAPGSALYVRDRSAETTTVVSLLPSGEEAYAFAGTARFTGDGSTIVYGTANAELEASPSDRAEATYKRTLPAGTAELFVAGASPQSISADGRVVTWTRALAPAVRPAGSGVATPQWAASYAGAATGYTVEGRAPVVVQRSKYVERPNAPAEYCPTGGANVDSYHPSRLRVSDDGGALLLDYTGWSTSYSGYGPALRFAIRKAGAQWPTFSTGGAGGGGLRSQTTLLDLGETGESTLSRRVNQTGGPTITSLLAPAEGLPELPGEAWGTPGVENARFFAHDTGVLTGEWLTDASVVAAYDPIREGVAPAATEPTPAEAEFADRADLTPDVQWSGCAPAPIGTPEQYAVAEYPSVFTTSQSAGTITVRRRGLVRAPLKTTITVKVFGLPLWARTVPGDPFGSQPTTTVVTLPKPWWILPQSATITTSFAAVGDQPAQSLIRTKRWQAWR